MTEKQKKSPENLSNSQKLIDEKINQLTYNYLKKYTTKKESLKKLANFETSKGLKELEKKVLKLKESGELKENINIKNLFKDLQKLKKEIQKIKESAKNSRENLKAELNKKFSPNEKYDLAELIKQKNPLLYQAIISPKGVKQHIISAGVGIGNSLYKTGIGLGKLSLDLIKLLTFQVSLKDIKEQFKRV